MGKKLNTSLEFRAKYSGSSGLHEAAVTMGRVGGRVGGRARARALTQRRRTEIAREGGKARQRKS